MIYKLLYNILHEEIPTDEEISTDEEITIDEEISIDKKRIETAFETLKRIAIFLEIDVEKLKKEIKQLTIIEGLFEELISQITQKTQTIKMLEKELFSQIPKNNEEKSKVETIETKVKEKILNVLLGPVEQYTMDRLSRLIDYLQSPEISKLTNDEIVEMRDESHRSHQIPPVIKAIDAIIINDFQELRHKEGKDSNFLIAIFTILETRSIKITSRLFDLLGKCAIASGSFRFLKPFFDDLQSNLPKESQYIEMTYSQYVQENNQEENLYRGKIINELMSTKTWKLLSAILENSGNPLEKGFFDLLQQKITRFLPYYIGLKLVIIEKSENSEIVVKYKSEVYPEDLLTDAICAYTNANLYFGILLEEIKEHKILNYSTLVAAIKNEILSKYFSALIYYLKIFKLEDILRKGKKLHIKEEKKSEETLATYLNKIHKPSAILENIQKERLNPTLPDIPLSISPKREEYIKRNFISSKIVLNPFKIIKYMIIQKILKSTDPEPLGSYIKSQKNSTKGII